MVGKESAERELRVVHRLRSRGDKKECNATPKSTPEGSAGSGLDGERGRISVMCDAGLPTKQQSFKDIELITTHVMGDAGRSTKQNDNSPSRASGLATSRKPGGIPGTCVISPTTLLPRVVDGFSIEDKMA